MKANKKKPCNPKKVLRIKKILRRRTNRTAVELEHPQVQR